MQSRRAPAFINTCHDARFASHVGANIIACLLTRAPPLRWNGRGPTSRRTSMRAAPDCRPPPIARHASPPHTSTSHPPQQQDAVHRELRPGTGKGASASAGPPRRATRQAAGRAPPPPPPALPPQPHTTRPPPTTTGRRKGGYPVVSNRPLHRAMQQGCHHPSASARSQSWPPMPRPRLQLAARREKVQLRIREQSFFKMKKFIDMNQFQNEKVY